MALKFPSTPYEGMIHTHGTLRKYIYEGGRWKNYSNVYALSEENVNFATEAYVDSAVQVLDTKSSVTLATTAPVTLIGLDVIDGIRLLEGNTVLVKDQVDARQNGLYVAKPDNWVRRTDANTTAKVTTGLTVSVDKGATNANSTWVLTTKDIDLSQTPLTFARFGTSVSVDDITLKKTGEVVSVDPSITPYDIGSIIFDMPDPAAVVGRIPCVRSFHLPLGLAGSMAVAETAATNQAVFTIKKNDLAIGSFTFAAGSKVATFSFPAAVALTTGDVITIHSPYTQDATLAEVAYTLMGNLQ